MHPEAMRGVHWAIQASGAKSVMPPIDRGVSALDLGGADINGNARRLVERMCGRVAQLGSQLTFSVTWSAWNIEGGPGITKIVDATLPIDTGWWNYFDVVLCTELLEHVKDWRAVIQNIHHVLRPGGFAFITCASTGRQAHGARGDVSPGPGEWYQNVVSWDLEDELSELFKDWSVRYNPNPGDAYAWARK